MERMIYTADACLWSAILSIALSFDCVCVVFSIVFIARVYLDCKLIMPWKQYEQIAIKPNEYMQYASSERWMFGGVRGTLYVCVLVIKRSCLYEQAFFTCRNITQNKNFIQFNAVTWRYPQLKSVCAWVHICAISSVSTLLLFFVLLLNFGGKKNCDI